MKPPFMIREASLPVGFPPPGPVDQVILKEYPTYRAARVSATGGERVQIFFHSQILVKRKASGHVTDYVSDISVIFHHIEPFQSSRTRICNQKRS